MDAINQPEMAINRVFAKITSTPSTMPDIIQNH
jgi:hypothetical protein